MTPYCLQRIVYAIAIEYMQYACIVKKKVLVLGSCMNTKQSFLCKKWNLNMYSISNGIQYYIWLFQENSKYHCAKEKQNYTALLASIRRLNF